MGKIPDYLKPNIELGPKPENSLTESFSWLSDNFMVQKQDGKNKVKIKGVAVPGNAVSRNNRQYVDEELKRAARTFIDAPITVNHAPWMDKHNHRGRVNWMEYDADGKMEYVAEVTDPSMVAELRLYAQNPAASKIRGVSIEADYLHLQCSKCGEKFTNETDWRNHMEKVELIKDSLQVPHGIRGRALSLVLAPEECGVTDNTLEVMEKLGGFNTLIETYLKDRNLTEYIEKRDGEYCVISHETGEPIKCFPTEEEAQAFLKSISNGDKDAVKSEDPKVEEISNTNPVYADLNLLGTLKEPYKSAFERVIGIADNNVLEAQNTAKEAQDNPFNRERLAELKRSNDLKERELNLLATQETNKPLKETVNAVTAENATLKESNKKLMEKVIGYENELDRVQAVFKGKNKQVIKKPEVNTVQPYKDAG